MKKIYLGSDHAGFVLKEKIKKNLSKKGFLIFDSTPELIEGDDYSDYAFRVGERVSKDKTSLGVLICGSGTGMIIAANKVKGIRASMIYDKYSAKMARYDNDSNIACLRGRKFSFAKNIKILDIWLKTKFSGIKRHRRRIKKIERYEK
ncbi:MAG: RpiB/LacA/LacB family sugar-phosphate isomerase [Nanoarchaeota archaeon]